MGDTVQQILRDVEITDSLHRVSFRGRRSEYKSEPTAIPTILVVFRHQKGSQELSSKRCQAAKMICSKLQSWLPGLSVELIDERLLMHPRCCPVPSSHPITSKWSQICDEIIDSSDMTTWSGITCWQYGAESQWCENPVTLVVKLMENASGPFVITAQRIRSILARFEIHDVDVLFMKNGSSSQYSGRDADLSKDACSRYALPGVSIGVKGSTAGPATFGGFVELKLPGDLEWRCYGLTCFHCILEPYSTSPTPPVSRDKAALRYWRNHPVEPEDQEAANLFQIEHPASSDVASMIKELQTQIDDDPEDKRLCEDVRSGVPMTPWELRNYELHREWTTARTEEQDFFKDVLGSNLLLGHVFAGSGLNRFIPLPANGHTTESNSGLPKNCRFLD